MIASLPMYESSANAWAHDELWTILCEHLRAEGIDAPERLTRRTNPWDDWENPDLLLSQTCGLPFKAKLHRSLSLVAAPAIWVPDFTDGPARKDPKIPIPLAAGRYYSLVVAHKDDKRRHFAEFDGARVAYNDPISQSGWGLLHQLCTEEGVEFSSGIQTGGHRNSALSVVKGRADIAAIDVATWFGPMAEDRWTDQLRIIARTPLSPALPFVTAKSDLVEPLFAALKAAMSYVFKGIEDLEILHDVLNIAPDGVVPARLEDYMAIPLPPPPPSGSAAI